MKYLLGIDIGTTNVKAVLFERDGTCAGSANCPYPTSYPSPGRAEQNPEDWYDAVIRAVRELLAANSIQGDQIISVGFSGQIRSVAFLDGDFRTLYPGIVWSDTRSSEEAECLNFEMQDRLVQITGNQAATNFALPHILWMKKYRSDIFEQTRYFVTPKDYIIFRLTGKFASDASSQSGSLLIDLDKKDWSEELLKKTGISREYLPTIYSSIDNIGCVTLQAAKETGLRQGLPVIVGGGDNDCAAIGSGAYRLGTTSVSLGTAGIVLNLLDMPLRTAAGKLDVFSHVIPGRHYAMGMVLSAGMSLGWLKKRLVDETLSQWGADQNISMNAWLASLFNPSDTLAPGSEGLYYFPYLQGRGNPDKDPSAKGVFWGLTGSHGNKQMVQAVMEGVGYSIRQCLAAISKVSPVVEVICCGKGSSNELWMNILANILGKPVWTNDNIEVASLGAAILAGTGAGIFKSVEQGCEVMTKRDKQYVPHEAMVLQYEDGYRQFRSLTNAFWSRGEHFVRQ